MSDVWLSEIQIHVVFGDTVFLKMLDRRMSHPHVPAVVAESRCQLNFNWRKRAASREIVMFARTFGVSNRRTALQN
jgi:hypothetical protein